jgi:hypothetical protein
MSTMNGSVPVAYTIHSYSYSYSYSYSFTEDSNTSFGLGGGYRLNNKYSMELGYSDLGQLIVKEKITSIQISEPSISTITSKWKMLQASALANLPVSSSINLYGRIRVAKISEDLTQEAISTQSNVKNVEKKSSNTAIIGVGSNFELNSQFKLRIEYLYFNSSDTYHPSSSVSFGVMYYL